jgi:hypothetical protein
MGCLPAAGWKEQNDNWCEGLLLTGQDATVADGLAITALLPLLLHLASVFGHGNVARILSANGPARLVEQTAAAGGCGGLLTQAAGVSGRHGGSV